jgi:signal transduction histidine kinase
MEHAAFYVVDRDWQCTLAGGTLDIVDDPVGRPLWELVPHASRGELERAMGTRVAVRCTEFDPSRSLWFEVDACPVRDGIAVFVRDATADAEARAAELRQIKLEQQLVGIVSHDLRDLLNAVIVGTDLLARSEDALTAKIAQRVTSSAERAGRLVRDLLDFTQSRFGAGMPIHRTTVDLHACVARVIEDLRTAYPERTIVHEEEGFGSGEWDADRLGQVIHNLVTNALQHGPPDSAVRVTSRIDGDHATIEVHNLGKPIPEDLVPELFKPFRRGAAETHRRSGSIGLGLYIVEQIVLAHEGTVSVQSASGHGTTFSVKLPRKAQPSAPVSSRRI